MTVVPPALTILPGEGAAIVLVIRSVLASITLTVPVVLSETSNLAAPGVGVGVGVPPPPPTVLRPGEHPIKSIPKFTQSTPKQAFTAILLHISMIAMCLP